MADKTIDDLMKSLLVIRSVVRVHAAEIAERLTKLFAPLLKEAERPPDWELTLWLMLRLLELGFRNLNAAHDEWETRRRREHWRRQEREAAKKAVHDRLLSLKRTLSGTLRDKAGQVMQLKGELSRDWVVAEKEAKLVLRLLQEVEAPLRSGTLEFDPEVWRKPLKDELKALEDANHDVVNAKKRIEVAAADRRAALKEYGALFVRIAGALEAFCRLVAMERVARVAQPSRKYPGRTLAEIKQLGKAPSKKSKKKSAARKSDEDASS